ncbi:MAG: hypothetical protein ACKVYV_12980 [Limisphaerales bacterium]
MNLLPRLAAVLLAFAALWLLPVGQAQNPPELDITGTGAARVIPISLSGFDGEVGQVLRFDLEIAGFKVTGPDEAQFTLAGGSSPVRGQLAPKGGAALFNKEYSGASLRQQAHALADDVVLAVTGRPGIARTRIAFRVDPAPRQSEIYVADFDGGGAVAVTADASTAVAPAWVPGRRMLLYTSYKRGGPDIFSHDLGSGARRAVAEYNGLNASPAVSPDGRRVAMILSKDGNVNLYVANLDGGGVKRLTSHRQDDSSPTWSPDGTQICFSSRAGRSGLYVIPAGGGTPRRLSLDVANATEPDWSPDGRHIVFTTQRGGNLFEICVVKSSGGSVTALVPGEDPSWAPNSRTVIFARRGGGARSLSLLDVPTRRTKDLPRFSGSASQPAWAR